MRAAALAQYAVTTYLLTAVAVRGDNVTLAVILPSSSRYAWTLSTSLAAIETAVATVNNRSDVLPTVTLRVIATDSRCSDTTGPHAAVNMYLYHAVHAFIGPVCDAAVAPIARLSSAWNIPVLTTGAFRDAFAAKRHFQLLTRVGGTYAQLARFLAVVCRYFRFRVLSLIYHNNMGRLSGRGNSRCYYVMESLHTAMLEQRRRQNGTRYREPFWYVSYDENNESHNITAFLTAVVKHARSESPCTPISSSSKSRTPVV